MTRKDYVLITATFAKERAKVAQGPIVLGDAVRAIDSTAREMAYRLAQDNARFAGDRFLRACGVAQ